MKIDNKLVAEGLHPNDVEWLETEVARLQAFVKAHDGYRRSKLESEVARLNKLNEWLLETLEAVLRGEISHPEQEG